MKVYQAAIAGCLILLVQIAVYVAAICGVIWLVVTMLRALNVIH